MMKAYNLENRLIDFAVSIIEWAHSLSITEANLILRKQIIRSATSVALNYGEARAGESVRDFVHKLSLSLKELRETKVCLEILLRINPQKETQLGQECRELIAIVASSINTTKKRMTNRPTETAQRR